MFFLGILFLINTVDSSIATANSGRIIQVGNSGTVGAGVGERVELGIVEGVDCVVGVMDDVEFWIGVGDGDAIVVDIEGFWLGNASGLGSVKKGTKFTVPKLKSFLKS